MLTVELRGGTGWLTRNAPASCELRRIDDGQPAELIRLAAVNDEGTIADDTIVAYQPLGVATTRYAYRTTIVTNITLR